ncbi:hypothetical protein [Mycolicibacterium diernhoferi]|nr:hypothetical protein [Mycolicibacterium diernhoferi]OJZ66416.1 hypothetical protein BRW64_09050 [Mycolicibacterium diernhoferi]PEG54216.1 hypothetical protein CRI78_12815 [Mycolicibacterium diernhoferi]QYL24589.1 hypothetical protein K0O62_10210 [Mycolicibacterium diernhoferi]
MVSCATPSPVSIAAADSRKPPKPDPSAEYDDEENPLMQLFLEFAQTALAVEVQGDTEPKHAEGARFMTITHARRPGFAESMRCA